MRLGVGLFGTEPVAKVVGLVRLAEALGYSNAWIGDSQNIWREAFLTMGAAAAATTKITIGTGVTNLQTRHSSVLASGWATLAEMVGPERAVLGVGLGDSALRTMGGRPSSLANLEQGIADLRTVFAGGEAGGFHLNYGVPFQIPIYIAASAPKILRLAGRIADGVIMLVGTNPRFVEAGLATISAGAAEVGRTLADLEVVLWTPTSILSDGAIARQLVKPHIARILIRPLPAALDERDMSKIAEIKAGYDYYQHMNTEADHGRLVPDDLVPHFALAGTREECASILAGLRTTGVDQIAIIPYVPPGHDRAHVIQAFADLAGAG